MPITSRGTPLSTYRIASGAPAPLALEDAGLAAHDRERHGHHRDQRRGGQAVEPQHDVEQRGEQQEQHAERDRGAVGDPEDRLLDLRDVLGLGGDPPRRRRLQAELEHGDHQQGGHQARERAVRARAEHARGDHREAVGRDVHDPHRDRDRAAAAEQRGRSHGTCEGHGREGSRPRRDGLIGACTSGVDTCRGSGRLVLAVPAARSRARARATC